MCKPPRQGRPGLLLVYPSSHAGAKSKHAQHRAGRGVGWGRKTMKKLGLPEQPQQNLRPLIGQAQCLHTKLLTDLQRLKR